MLGKRVGIGAVLLLIGPLAALGQTRTKVAVVPPEGGLPPALAERVAASLAAAADSAGREVVRTAVPLQEVLLTVECPEPTPACRAVAGRNLGVGEVLQVRMTPQGAGWRAEITLFDVPGARVVRRAERQFAADPGDDELRQLGQAVFMLEAAPPAAPRSKWRLRLRPRTWITAASGAGLLLVGGILGGLSLAAQKDFDGTTNPVPGDPAGVRHFVDLADKGQAYAISANVFFGIGAAALVVSGVFFYRDWHKLEVQPVAGPRTAGLLLRRSF